MNKTKLRTTIILSAAIAVILTLACIVIAKYGTMLNVYNTMYEPKLLDFTVTVELTNAASLDTLDKDYTAEDFPEIDALSVIELYPDDLNNLRRYMHGIPDANGYLPDTDTVNLYLSAYRRPLKIILTDETAENVYSAVKILEARDDIKLAYPHEKAPVLLYGNSERTISDDQWALKTIQAENAWKISQGTPEVLVGVLDTGIDATHPSLNNNIYRSANHNIETTLHRDFAVHPYGDGLAILEPEDPTGHGTQVASVIAGMNNKNSGVCGIAPNIKIVSLRVASASQERTQRATAIACAINYAKKHNIKILNLSCGIDDFGNDFTDAIKNYDGLIVTAVGNDKSNIDINPNLPSSLNYENILSVGATNKKNEIATWWEYGLGNGSNYGQNSVDIFAPGDKILCATPNNEYVTKNGTSLAAPLVSGVAALMLSHNPALTLKEIKTAIMDSATKIDSLQSLCVSGGILNAYEALKSVGFIINNNSTNVSIQGIYNTFAESITIPKKINGIPVLSIEANAFYYNLNLKSVFFQNGCSLLSIGESAFEECRNLTHIDPLPNTVNRIYRRAFYGCTWLSSITFSDNITKIYDETFFGCMEMKSVQIREQTNQIASIGNKAFYYCPKLETINIPKSISAIGSEAFADCTSIKNIIIPSKVKTIGKRAFSGWSVIQNIFIQDKLNPPENWKYWDLNCNAIQHWLSTEYTQGLSFYPIEDTNKQRVAYSVSASENLDCSNTVIIPSIYGGLPVTRINRFADNQDLRKIFIPKSITVIAANAFKNCQNLSDIIFEPESKLTCFEDCYVGSGTFNDCMNLKNIVIPSSVEKIGCYTFAYSGIESITFEEGSNLQIIGVSAFEWCENLESIIIPNSIELIDNNAFWCCNKLSNCTITPSETYANKLVIGNAIFYACKITNFSIPKNVVSIGNQAFGLLWDNWGQRVLLSFDYTANEKYIPNIKDYSLNVTIKSDTIKEKAFENCINLNSITIPANVKSIESRAFYNCTSLSKINYNAYDCDIGDNAFYNIGKNIDEIIIKIYDGVLTVPNNLLDNTKNLKSIHIPCSVTSISEQAFVNCSGLESLTVDANNNIYKSDNNCIIKKDDNVLVAGCKNSIIPEYVSAIGNYAFAGSGITELVLPIGISTIGNDAFNGCESLVSIDLSENLISISAHAFTNCKKLTNLTLPQKLESISDWAFSYCESLTEITIPSSVQSMGKAVFLWCKKLQTATFEDGCTFDETAIGIFYYCTKLNTVNLPNSITLIPREMFYHCLSLKNVNFGNNSRVQQIKTGAFANNSLISITLPESLEHIQYSAFTCDNLICIYLDKPYADSPITVIDESALSYCNNFSAIIIQNPISAENHKLANLTYADNIITDKSIIWSGISDCVDINSLPYTEDLQINNTVLLCEIYENLHNYANDKENYKYEADYILNRITNNYECNGVLIYTDMDDESTKILIELFYEFSIPFIVITDDLADIDNGITLSRDYFSIGYNVAKSYYDFLSENDNLDLYMNISRELLYCPIVAENYYKSNIPFLLGASQIFEYPVVVLSFDEFKYKFGNEENTDSNKNYADTVPTTTQFYQWLFFSLKNESFIHETMSNDVSDWVFFYYDCDIDFCYMFDNAFVIFDYACEIAETTLNNLNAETMDYSNYMFEYSDNLHVDYTTLIETLQSLGYEINLDSWYDYLTYKNPVKENSYLITCNVVNISDI